MWALRQELDPQSIRFSIFHGLQREKYQFFKAKPRKNLRESENDELFNASMTIQHSM